MDREIIFVNRIVYERDEELAHSKIQLFVSESEFDRGISIIVKGARTVRTVIFPDTVREVKCGAFDKNQFLKSAVLNEGLEILEGGNGDKNVGAFYGTQLKEITLPATVKVLGNNTFQNCETLKSVIF